MKDHSRRRGVISRSKVFFWCTLVVVFSCVFLTTFTFRHFFRDRLQPEIVSAWRQPATGSAFTITTTDSRTKPLVSIRETVMLPDQVLIFLNYPRASRLFTKEDFNCVYFSPNSSLSSEPSEPQLQQPPNQIDGHDLNDQIVRCPLNPRGFIVSLELKSSGDYVLNPVSSHRWDSLVYEATIDRDNTTVVFVKGFNLRPDRIYNASKFECVYGWDFRAPKFLLRSNVIFIAQEIARCRTPLSILNNQLRGNNSIKVSIRLKGRGTLHSIARPRSELLMNPGPGLEAEKPYEMCICTMLRNQGRFLKEWVMYHAQIGVQRWFVYDNNSEDDIDTVIQSLTDANFNISRHVWPWVKTQEAGFAHCSLRARSLCEWVGFIDVDEFFHLPAGLNLQEAVKSQSRSDDNVAELRVSCHSFGPSGLKHVPAQGVTVGYTCRMALPERHKSIVKPEALNSTLINVVHHFHLKDGYRYVNADRGVLVINHYKYQVWEVFKEKFYRRVATYVVDWQNEQNVGSKDRAPGLGTRAVEPPDWPSKFCEVTDTELKDRILQNFKDPLTDLLPWQEEEVGSHNKIADKGKGLQ